MVSFALTGTKGEPDSIERLHGYLGIIGNDLRVWKKEDEKPPAPR